MGKKIIAIGDSIVYGRIDPIHGGWVGRLRSWYVPQKPSENAVFNLGIGGETISKLLRRFEVECRTREADIILIGIGVNDCRKVGSPKCDYETPPELFANSLDSLLQLSKRLSPLTVFVGMTPVDESRTTPIPIKNYWHLVDAQRMFDEITRDQCQKHGIPYIDNFTRWMNLGKSLLRLGKPNYTRLLADGLHPNAKGHEFLFETIRAFLQENSYP
ncbi:MAG: GDSL-type esterase/lipase family protein [Cyanobacteriota bacterium]